MTICNCLLVSLSAYRSQSVIIWLKSLIYISIILCIYLSIYLSIFAYMFVIIYSFVRIFPPRACLVSEILSYSSSVHFSHKHYSLLMPLYNSLFISIYLSIYLSQSLYLFQSVHIYLSISACPNLSFSHYIYISLSISACSYLSIYDYRGINYDSHRNNKSEVTLFDGRTLSPSLFIISRCQGNNQKMPIDSIQYSSFSGSNL
ncbi:unnamed protein product [Acanthosepion pharaonis]|uniref:Uncharacterized protein n=1 Tax=Acanthosepion pharaonis TaxID=158019 RepID=A0A812DAB9_ACAPH|nr:unnamed protein product [Sepia pharaonis]